MFGFLSVSPLCDGMDFGVPTRMLIFDKGTFPRIFAHRRNAYLRQSSNFEWLLHGVHSILRQVNKYLFI